MKQKNILYIPLDKITYFIFHYWDIKSAPISLTELGFMLLGKEGVNPVGGILKRPCSQLISTNPCPFLQCFSKGALSDIVY